MRRFTINLRSCIKRLTRRDDSQSSDVWSREETLLCLQMLNRTKNTKLRKAILEHADADLISALCECAHNILRGTVRLTPREKVRLRKYKDKLRLISEQEIVHI